MRQITQTQLEQKTLKSAGFMEKFRPAGLSISAGDGSLSEIRENSALYDHNGDTAIVADSRRKKYKEKFAPAGQTTQMIIGASPETDKQIIKTSEALYHKFSMKRVYFSAYIPVTDNPALPSQLKPPPLKREHRLYQADWLLRFYGFSADEILTDDDPNLDCDFDPKLAWALRNIEHFPIEVNRASEEELLRIPGVGNTSAIRIMKQRRVASVKYDDLKKIGVVLKRARFFLTCNGKYYGDKEFSSQYIRKALGGGEKPQISLFEMMAANVNGNELSGSLGNELYLR